MRASASGSLHPSNVAVVAPVNAYTAQSHPEGVDVVAMVKRCPAMAALSLDEAAALWISYQNQPKMRRDLMHHFLTELATAHQGQMKKKPTGEATNSTRSPYLCLMTIYDPVAETLRRVYGKLVYEPLSIDSPKGWIILADIAAGTAVAVAGSASSAPVTKTDFFREGDPLPVLIHLPEDIPMNRQIGNRIFLASPHVLASNIWSARVSSPQEGVGLQASFFFDSDGQLGFFTLFASAKQDNERVQDQQPQTPEAMPATLILQVKSSAATPTSKCVNDDGSDDKGIGDDINGPPDDGDEVASLRSAEALLAQVNARKNWFSRVFGRLTSKTNSLTGRGGSQAILQTEQTFLKTPSNKESWGEVLEIIRRHQEQKSGGGAADEDAASPMPPPSVKAVYDQVVFAKADGLREATLSHVVADIFDKATDMGDNLIYIPFPVAFDSKRIYSAKKGYQPGVFNFNVNKDNRHKALLDHFAPGSIRFQIVDEETYSLGKKALLVGELDFAHKKDKDSTPYLLVLVVRPRNNAPLDIYAVYIATKAPLPAADE